MTSDAFGADKNRRVVVIAQARMGSSRLPGKVMADLCGKPVVERVIDRALRSRLATDFVLATTTDAADDPLAHHLESISVHFVRGSVDDVLSRYALAAEEVGADVVVRITCDCPLIDPATIDAVISAFDEDGAVDYCSNTLERTYPLGMDVEVFSREALERANAQARQQDEREHVTLHMYRHPERFRLRNVEAPEGFRRPSLRLTVDELADLELVRELCARIGVDASLAEMIAETDRDPALASRNQHIEHRHTDKSGGW